ncbi:hypothetical protein [Paenarthrobacter nicotinovorans]|uniref:hypothetical protein n=1 Tax=Paenarthrobacter nicotinovorans TaxID=29320 RepID=UPI0011A79C9A|nr:hypothetical protein [Paenarthrobacter nicotinovorans]
MNDHVLDDRQQRVNGALLKRSSQLAAMYRLVLSILAAPTVAGQEVARVSVICHGGRELMNGVPSVMSEIDIPRPDPNSDTLKRRLPELLREIELDVDQDLVPVPRSAAKTLSQLISAVAQEQGRNRRLASAVVTGATDDKHPAIKQWMEAQRFFLRWTHLDRLAEGGRDLPGDAELMSNLRIVEDVIDARAGLFFENLHSIEALLAEANFVEIEEQA